MNEFDRRKKEVGPPDGKSEERRLIDAAYVLGANPDHPGGGPALRQLAEHPNPRVREAAEAELYTCNDDPDNEGGSGEDD